MSTTRTARSLDENWVCAHIPAKYRCGRKRDSKSGCSPVGLWQLSPVPQKWLTVNLDTSTVSYSVSGDRGCM